MNGKQITYQVGLLAGMVSDGTADYFIKHGFTSAMLIAEEPRSYAQERIELLKLGYTDLSLDVEQLIWAGGSHQSAPISNFSGTLTMYKNEGWTTISSEGGRAGDNDYFASLGLKYLWLNCDLCGIWRTNDHLHPNTVYTDWECYYALEVPYIKQGVADAAAKGKPNGITLGVWQPNNDMHIDENGNPTSAKYKELLDWSYQNNTPITKILVWFGIGNTFGSYAVCGFDTIISNLQKDYPPDLGPIQPPKSLDDLLGKVQQTIAPAYVVWPLIGIWDDKGNALLALEQKRIEPVEKLWEHAAKNKVKADKLEIRERGDVYYFGNGIWYTEGSGWQRYK